MLTRFFKYPSKLMLAMVAALPFLSHAQSLVLAPGYGELGYDIPAIGSYQLPPLGVATDGEILDADGNRRRLYDLFGDNYVLLAFIYSRCSDVNGCPLTSHVFYQLKSAMKNDAELAKNLKLISLSFDPENDTPDIMKLYGNNFRYAGQSGEWQFLTTESVKSLMPILRAYNQDVQRQYASDGAATQDYSHVLRVFLIDPQKKIRNIYSVAFLHQALISNDFKTLRVQATANPSTQKTTAISSKLSGPGDSKLGYENADYATRSRALELRQGKATDLLSIARKPPLGLPPIDGIESLDRAKIELGRKLFFDRRLSLNDTFSCAMCHVPDQGFTSNEVAMAVGIEGRSVRRNSPTIYNVAYADLLFHDGRENDLGQQIWGPLLARNEMGNPSIGYVLDKIRQIDEYDGQFEAAFDGKALSMTTLGEALASYQKTLVSADSAFDRWYYDQQSSSLSAAAQRGLKLFQGKANCSSCHHIGTKSALFMDNQLHNTGIGYRESMGITPEKLLVQLAPGISVEVETALIEKVSEPAAADVGQYEITQNPYDRWKYKTPSLRNIALTAPYMHNGSLSTLGDVIEFYNSGGIANEGLSPLIKPLGLSKEEKLDIESFLQALTGSNVDTLVADAFAAPIGDVKKGNPSWVHGSQFEVK